MNGDDALIESLTGQICAVIDGAIAKIVTEKSLQTLPVGEWEKA